MKVVVAAFNQEKALVGAFSVIMNLRMKLFEALAEVVTSLLEAGASWRLPDARGWSCLQLAVVRGAADCVTALLHHGAPGDGQPLHGALQLAAAAPGRGHGAAGPRVAADQQGRGQQRAPPRPHGAGGGAGAGGRGEDCLRNSGGRVEARGGEAESVYSISISICTTAQVRLPTPPPTPGSVARAATLDRWRWRLEHLELDTEDSEGEEEAETAEDSGDSEGEETAETAEDAKQLHHSDHDQVDNEINEQNKPSWKKCDFKHTSDLKSKGREIGADVMTPSSVDVGIANVANYKEMRSALLQQLDQIKLKHKEKVSNEIEEKKKSYNQALER